MQWNLSCILLIVIFRLYSLTSYSSSSMKVPLPDSLGEHILKGTQEWTFLKYIFAETKSWSQGAVTPFWFGRDNWFLNISAHTQPAIKLFFHMLRLRWNMFCVSSASDKICFVSAQHILNVNFEMGWDFPFCWTCANIGYSLAEHAWKLVSGWLSTCKNWLLVGWACAKVGYSLAEHTQKSFQCTKCISSLIPFHPFLCPLFESLSNVLCPPSHVFALCLPSLVPCLMALLLVSHLLSPVLLALLLILCSLYPFYQLTFRRWVSPSVDKMDWWSYSSPIFLSEKCIRWLSKRWNHFCVCSASNEIIFLYAEQAMNSFPSMLSMQWNCFPVGSACYWISM